MSTSPSTTINLDSPMEIFEADGKQWNQDSTESAKNGTLKELIMEPLELLTSSSSSMSIGHGRDASLSSLATGDEKIAFLTMPEANRSNQLLSAGNGKYYLGLSQQTRMPVSSNGHHQMHSLANTSNRQPGTSNGHGHQISMPGTTSGSSYGMSSYDVHYTGSNGNVGYSSNMSGVQTVRLPIHVVHPLQPNGGYSFPNEGNGSQNGVMVDGPYVRSGWPINATNKVMNGVKKQKRNRTAFTSHQMMELEQEYARARYLDRTRRIELATTLGLNQRTVKIWFQNRRMKEKKDRLEEMAASDLPPSNMDDLPIFVQDGQQYIPVGIENGHFNPALCADMPMPSVSMPSMSMPSMSMPSMMMPPMPMSMPPMPMPPAPTPSLEMQYMPENAIQVNGVQAQQPPVPVPAGAGTENPAGAYNAEENWDLSWIRSINISDDLELQ